MQWPYPRNDIQTQGYALKDPWRGLWKVISRLPLAVGQQSSSTCWWHARSPTQSLLLHPQPLPVLPKLCLSGSDQCQAITYTQSSWSTQRFDHGSGLLFSSLWLWWWGEVRLCQKFSEAVMGVCYNEGLVDITAKFCRHATNWYWLDGQCVDLLAFYGKEWLFIISTWIKWGLDYLYHIVQKNRRNPHFIESFCPRGNRE